MPMKKVTDKDFQLLLSFLDDENDGTRTLARSHVKSFIEKNPRLIELGRNIDNPSLKNAFVDFLEQGQFEKLEPAFRRLFNHGAQLDLEKGFCLLASIAYPELKQKTITDALDHMAEEVSQLIVQLAPQPTKGLNAMRRYLFEKQKFMGNHSNFFDPDNCFINRVLERKTGIPISLSCVYIFIGWRLSLPVHGVGLPGHFVVGHRTPRGVTYIDAFNKGKTLRVKDCEVLVRRMGVPFRQAYLDPMSNLDILARQIVNLINIYSDMGLTVKARRMAQLLQMAEE